MHRSARVRSKQIISALLTMVALHLKPLSNIRRLRHDQLLMVLKSAVCLSHARHEDTRLRILGLGALLSMSADIRQSFILCLIQELLRSAHGQLTGHMCSLLLSVAAELITSLDACHAISLQRAHSSLLLTMTRVSSLLSWTLQHHLSHGENAPLLMLVGRWIARLTQFHVAPLSSPLPRVLWTDFLRFGSLLIYLPVILTDSFTSKAIPLLDGEHGPGVLRVNPSSCFL